MQTLLRSGRLDIKDAQCAVTKDLLKMSYHIISAFAFQKGRFERPKIQFSSKVAKFLGKIRINLTLISLIEDFFVQFLVYEMWLILYFFLQDMAEIFFWRGALSPPPNRAAPLDPACFRIEVLSRNRLASTAYFAIPRYAISLPWKKNEM